MAGGLLDTLTAAIDDLAAIDLDTVDDAELHDVVVALGGLSTRLEAQWCRLIGRWDARQIWAGDGSKAAGARLARETHWRRGDCDRLVRRARDLAVMPATGRPTAPGRSAGRMSIWSGRATGSGATPSSPTAEEFLVNLCRTPFFAVAHRGIEYWKQQADLDAADRDADTVRQGRHLSASATWRGTVAIDGILDPLGGEIFKTELDRLCEQFRLEDLRDGVVRTATQRRADALVEMAMRSATAPADGLRPRPLFTVTIGIDPFNHLCQTAAGTVIAPGLLVPWLGDADIERIVYDPPNRHIEASWRRRFTGALRRIIEIRDGHCQHPGCDEPAVRCDVDHIVPAPRRDHLLVQRPTAVRLPQPHLQGRRRQGGTTAGDRSGRAASLPPRRTPRHAIPPPTTTAPVPTRAEPHPKPADRTVSRRLRSGRPVAAQPARIRRRPDDPARRCPTQVRRRRAMSIAALIGRYCQRPSSSGCSMSTTTT